RLSHRLRSPQQAETVRNVRVGRVGARPARLPLTAEGRAMNEAEAFESALRDNPDDLAGWCAYADYLVEQGVPRGEFMQVQLALEEEARPKKERAALALREAELLIAHERE